MPAHVRRFGRSPMERQQDYVLRTVEERGVRFIRLWFTDVLGQLKSFAITPAELENAFAEGMTFDGSAIDGFSRVQESDVLAHPDPNTFELLPWRDDDAPVACMFCDVSNLDGTAFEGDPRNVLRRNLDRAREKGFSFYAGPDMEYFYFATSAGRLAADPLDSGSYFDLTTADVASDLRKRTILALEAMGIPAGLLQHAREITAIPNQWVNSYKRLVIGYEAPVYVAWARNSRSALVRIPGAKRGKESSTRIEFRSPDPACNPYLAFSVILAAGLAGIDEGYELPPELTANLYEMTPEERAAEGVTALPGSLEEAINEMERSELV